MQSCKINRSSRGTFCPHLQSWRGSHARHQHKAASKLLAACFMLALVNFHWSKWYYISVERTSSLYCLFIWLFVYEYNLSVCLMSLILVCIHFVISLVMSVFLFRILEYIIFLRCQLSAWSTTYYIFFMVHIYIKSIYFVDKMSFDSILCEAL